jgi:2-succinyl-6-hydroxy-2,4-cyclohexadiene-1-carboxylate synthase
MRVVSGDGEGGRSVRVAVDDGVELQVDVRGEGPGLVLVHGFGGTKEDFADHVGALSASHRVVTFDHRGHGASGRGDDPAAYTLDRYAADTLQVADATGLSTFRLLGHSMGGMVARRVALAHPERVEALVLMDTSAGCPDSLDPDLMDAAAKIALEDGKEVLKSLLDAAATLDTPAHQRLVSERPGYQELEARAWDALSVVMWAGTIREIAHQPDELAALARVSCPVLVIVGEQDAAFLDACHAIASTIPAAHLAVIPDAGHSPQVENPDAWRAALVGFLDTLGTRVAP